MPVTNGVLHLETPSGTVEAVLTLGVAYARPVGVEHNVINGGTEELAFIEVELKG